jgi:hypothetical protein
MIHEHNWPVKEFVREQASLEEAFRYYVKSGVKKTTNDIAA